MLGSVLFEHESEKNTIKETVEKADLTGANLRGANLRGAYLRGAYLRDADLTGADLTGAGLTGAKMPIYCKWWLSINGDKIQIGCEEKTIPEWDAWFAGTEVYSTPRDTEEFKRIFAMYQAYKAYYLTMQEVK